MRNGYRVIDIDTHVAPSMEILFQYVEDDARDRLDQLKPYLRTSTTPPGRGHPEEPWTNLRVAPIPYTRVIGTKAEEEKAQAGAKGALEGRVIEGRNTKSVTPRVQHDNPTGRLADMDLEGVDIDFIIPGTWATAISALDITISHTLYRAYHRYMADYCSVNTERLKGLLLVPGADPEWAVAEIRRYGREPWVAAVWLQLKENLPLDDPDLEPIWQVLDEYDLPIVHHSFFYEPPYFPGYRDVWGNVAVARTAAHVWGAQRFTAFLICSGVLDRYPNVRGGLVECGHGWLPQWLIRLGEQISYVKGVVPKLKVSPIEYAQAGRIACGVEIHEGEAMTKAVIDLIGEDVLMYQSDYPHPENFFPNSTDLVLGWRSIPETAMRKLMYDNAARFLRL